MDWSWVWWYIGLSYLVMALILKFVDSNWQDKDEATHRVLAFLVSPLALILASIILLLWVCVASWKDLKET